MLYAFLKYYTGGVTTCVPGRCTSRCSRSVERLFPYGRFHRSSLPVPLMRGVILTQTFTRGASIYIPPFRNFFMFRPAQSGLRKSSLDLVH